MPDFSQHRRPAAKAPAKGLARDLRETQKDMRAAKRGEETEASKGEMKATAKRLREQIKAEVEEERKAMLRQLDPLQMATPRERSTKTSADTFKYKAPPGIAAARG